LRTSEIVHRDIKPENLLLDDAGHLKLSDFGCARAFFLAPASSSPASGPSLGGIGIKPERSTSFVGTAEYVSPEVLKNEPLSYPADLWALGCVIFQMLTGKPPFKGASEYLTFQLVSEGVYSYPSDDEAGGDKIPMEAKDLVDKLLVLEPDKRLGASSIDELKSHPYFTGVEWSRVRESKAPDFIRPSPPTADQEGLNWEFSSLMRDVEGQHGHIRYERTDDKDEDSD
jgi:3-phosphoinositide dependent protein kinase-1